MCSEIHQSLVVIAPAEVVARATRLHIPQQLALVNQLLKLGLTFRQELSLALEMSLRVQPLAKSGNHLWHIAMPMSFSILQKLVKLGVPKVGIENAAGFHVPQEATFVHQALQLCQSLWQQLALALVAALPVEPRTEIYQISINQEC
jgi:hypothetical protein